MKRRAVALAAVALAGVVSPTAGARPYAGRALEQMEAEAVVYLDQHGVPGAVAYPITYGNPGPSCVAARGPGAAFCQDLAGEFITAPSGSSFIVINPEYRGWITGCYRMRGRTRAQRDRLGWDCGYPAHLLLHEVLHGVSVDATGSPVTDEGLVDAVAADLAPGLAFRWGGQRAPDTSVAYPALVAGVRARSVAACGGGPWWGRCARTARLAWLNGWRPLPPEAGS